jgi:hypothetical protein
MLNPPGDVKIPAVYAPVPVNVTGAEFTVVQNGVPAYEMAAVGIAVIITDAVAVTAGHPPAVTLV